MKIGASISNIRKEEKMTQEEFAKLFHVTRQTVSNWENEKSYPDLETLVAISDNFHISLDQLIKGDKEMIEDLNKKIKQTELLKKNCQAFMYYYCTSFNNIYNYVFKLA